MKPTENSLTYNRDDAVQTSILWPKFPEPRAWSTLTAEMGRVLQRFVKQLQTR